MTDELSLTLNSPITDEQWDMLTDVDFEYTDDIIFHTKHGKEVKFVKSKIGRWIYDGYDHPHGVEWCHCSVCGNRDSVDSVYTQVDIYPYCAKCGARMMEVEHD